HGLTFALLHLACMRLIAQIVPSGVAGTAQALYGLLGVGVATALLTICSGFTPTSARAVFGRWRCFASPRCRRSGCCGARCRQVPPSTAELSSAHSRVSGNLGPRTHDS